MSPENILSRVRAAPADLPAIQSPHQSSPTLEPPLPI